eukprot:gene22944-biopygen11786
MFRNFRVALCCSVLLCTVPFSRVSMQFREVPDSCPPQFVGANPRATPPPRDRDFPAAQVHCDIPDHCEHRERRGRLREGKKGACTVATGKMPSHLGKSPFDNADKRTFAAAGVTGQACATPAPPKPMAPKMPLTRATPAPGPHHYPVTPGEGCKTFGSTTPSETIGGRSLKRVALLVRRKLQQFWPQQLGYESALSAETAPLSVGVVLVYSACHTLRGGPCALMRPCVRTAPPAAFCTRRVRFFDFYRVGRVRDASAAVSPCSAAHLLLRPPPAATTARDRRCGTVRSSKKRQRGPCIVAAESLHCGRGVPTLWPRSPYIVAAESLQCGRGVPTLWPRSPYIVAAESLHCGRGVPTLWTRSPYIVAAESLHCGRGVPTLWPRSPYIVAAESLLWPRSPYIVAAESLHCGRGVPTLWPRSPYIVAAESLHCGRGVPTLFRGNREFGSLDFVWEQMTPRQIVRNIKKGLPTELVQHSSTTSLRPKYSFPPTGRRDWRAHRHCHAVEKLPGRHDGERQLLQSRGQGCEKDTGKPSAPAVPARAAPRGVPREGAAPPVDAVHDDHQRPPVHRDRLGSQDTGVDVARAWRGLWAFFFLAYVAQTRRGHGALGL